jgi:hypothetical protein
MLREEAIMVTDYLKEGGYLTEELKEIINDNIIDDEVSLDLHLLRGRYELKQLAGYTVESVLDTTNEYNKKGTLISFKKDIPDAGNSCIDLSLSGDGNIYISDCY